ncbi:hypothetical protein PG984_016436 [Apiospora sp. TS-2023a]
MSLPIIKDSQHTVDDDNAGPETKHPREAAEPPAEGKQTDELGDQVSADEGLQEKGQEPRRHPGRPLDQAGDHVGPRDDGVDDHLQQPQGRPEDALGLGRRRPEERQGLQAVQVRQDRPPDVGLPDDVLVLGFPVPQQAALRDGPELVELVLVGLHRLHEAV